MQNLNATPPEISNKLKIAISQKHAAKISWKTADSQELCNEVKKYCESYDVFLPVTKKEFKEQIETILKYEEYGMELHNELKELISMYYNIKYANTCFYAKFTGFNGKVSPVLLSTLYSKHRFCHVWNYRKSQIIRKAYKDYLMETEIYKDYRPMHLVLTVPHPEGKYNDQEFYMKSMNEAFAKLRKTENWLQYIEGGEYGFEIKKSQQGNGLHIHVHSLCFIKKDNSKLINFIREELSMEWKALTGANGVFLETLYYYKRNSQGKKIIRRTEGNKVYFEKCYWHKGWNVQECVSAILEVIKYHFKFDSLLNKDGTYDIDTIKVILNNSRGQRFYSRFGFIYKEPKLSFNKLNVSLEEVEPSDIDTSEDEINLKGNSDRALKNLINPFTEEVANRSDYVLATARPERLKYMSKKSDTPYAIVLFNPSAVFRDFPPEMELKDCIIQVMEAVNNIKIGKNDLLIAQKDKKYQEGLKLVDEYKIRHGIE